MQPALRSCLLLARVDARLRSRLEVQGLSFHELAVLRILAAHPDRPPRRAEIGRGDLARQVGLTPSGITRLLAPLTKRGLVERLADPDDARRARIALTPAGREQVADALAQASERAESLLDELLSPEEQATLAELLARLVPTEVRESFGPA